MFIIHFALFITFLLVKVLAVPPAICREEFRWDDCGSQPQPVVYYWKKGSRCEIGLWKGCLPNPNMFANEYECINTCIYQEHSVARTESETEDDIKQSSDEEEHSAETNTTKGHNGDTTDKYQNETITNGEVTTDEKNGTATDASNATDTAQSDTAQTDAAQTDAAQSDTAQTDNAQTDTAPADTAQTDTAQTDTQTDTQTDPTPEPET